jgi:serine-type D-Ala-D-Ala carboxypeptidase (penicillin-binding protein 5/6)
MKYFFWLIIFSCFFTFLLFWKAGSFNGRMTYVSPLPDFLTFNKNNQATLLDLWLPFLTEASGGGLQLSQLTAKSVLVYDLASDKVIFEKDAKAKRPMASLTKIMTAIIAMENKKSDDEYVVSADDLVGEDSMGLVAGERLSQEELLYGLLLPSGNDAAETFASNYDGGRKAFVKAMNDKAKALALIDTNFTNPSGLQGDGNQYTTAYDLLVVTRYALENFPIFKKIVETPEYEIEETSEHKAHYLANETNLLTTYPGVKGVKTGYTPEAGLCLVTYLEYDGHKIIGIILNSENRRGEMKELLDSSLKSLGIEPPAYSG